MLEAAVLEDVLVLAATDMATLPLPVPLAPEVMESHEAPLVAVQEHPVWVVTVTLPDVAPEATCALVGLMEYVQPEELEGTV